MEPKSKSKFKSIESKSNTNNCSVDVSNQYECALEHIGNDIQSVETVAKLMQYLLDNYSNGNNVTVHNDIMQIINGHYNDLITAKWHADEVIHFLSAKVQELEDSNRCLMDIKNSNTKVSLFQDDTDNNNQDIHEFDEYKIKETRRKR